MGFSPEQTERLFDAFYSTKPDGMGMGLSISRSIAEAHGGRLWAESNYGARRYLPVHATDRRRRMKLEGGADTSHPA